MLINFINDILYSYSENLFHISFFFFISGENSYSCHFLWKRNCLRSLTYATSVKKNLIAIKTKNDVYKSRTRIKNGKIEKRERKREKKVEEFHKLRGKRKLNCQITSNCSSNNGLWNCCFALYFFSSPRPHIKIKNSRKKVYFYCSERRIFLFIFLL